MDKEQEKLFEKIRKLISLKEGAEEIGSIEEAANAQARISELVLKYNLDLSKMPGRKDKQNIITQKYTVVSKKTESDWQSDLMFTIAKFNMVKALRHGNKFGNNYYFSLIGEKINIDLVIFIFEQLSVRIKSMRLAAYKLANKEYPIPKNGYFRSYPRAVVKEIEYKLYEEAYDMKKKYEGGNQLMVLNDKAISDYIENTIGKIGTIKPQKQLGSYEGARDGRRDGENIQINKGLY